MRDIFPTYGSKNLTKFYALTILQNTWFIAPNWVFYFARFISLPKVGLIDSLSKIVSLVIEVPTGALADKFGRKNSLIAGHVALTACCIVVILARDFSMLLIGNCIMFVGFSLLSGAKEALLYDNMKAEKIDKHYEHVLGRIGFLVTITSVVTIFIGGLLYKFAPEATFYAWALCNLAATAILFGLKEHDYRLPTEQIDNDGYLNRLSDGLRTLFRRNFLHYTLLILYMAMLIKSYEGVIRQSTSMYFGLTGETFGYLFALVTIPSAIASYNFGRIYKKLGYKIIVPIFISYFLGFLTIYSYKSLPAFLISFTLIYSAQELAKPLITTTVNRHTHSKHRATTLSVVSLFSEIPYIIITGLFGSIFALGAINKFYLVQAVVVALVGIAVAIISRSKIKA